MNQQPVYPQMTITNPSPLFTLMLREDSNRSLQWLRAADYMPDPAERRYCLERTLYLDSTNTTAQNELRELLATSVEPENVSTPSFWQFVHHLIQSITSVKVPVRGQ